MKYRYLAWTLLVAACGIQAYLVITGSRYFVDLETIAVPVWLHASSKYLFDHYLQMPFFATTTILTVVLPHLAAILSWVSLGLRRKAGWTLALGVDLFFALPSLSLIGVNLAYVLGHPHAKMPRNPEDLLLFLAFLHILLLHSPPIRTLIFAHPEPPDPINDLTLPIITAR